MTPSSVMTLSAVSLLLLTSYVNALRMTMMQTTKTLPAVGIIGGGPAGLAAAIMLARRGYTDIKVFERLPEPLAPDSPLWVDFTQERSYNIGISGRGQRALRALDLMPALEKYSSDVVGRMDWAPETPLATPREVVYTGKSYVTKVIQRDRLASILLHELRTNPAYSSKVSVTFDTACTQVDFLPGDAAAGAAQTCRLHLAPTHASAPSSSGAAPDGKSGSDISSDSSSGSSSGSGGGGSEGCFALTAGLALGCDGTNSALRDAMAAASKGRLSVSRFEDKNVRVYRTIPLHLSPSQRADLNWSARTKSDVNLDALPTKGGPMLGVVLFRPWDTRITSLSSAAQARAFFDSTLPMFSPMVRDADLERWAAKESSRLPRFSYVGGAVHHGAAALVGDSIHTVKPYFGLGVNSAFEDVMALGESLQQHGDSVEESLHAYSKRRAGEARAMVQMSRRLDGGFFSFVLPLIVDSICHKWLPQVFSPNTLASLQNENLSFSFIQWRKRADRLMQAGLAAVAAFGLSRAAVAAAAAARVMVGGVGRGWGWGWVRGAAAVGGVVL